MLVAAVAALGVAVGGPRRARGRRRAGRRWRPAFWAGCLWLAARSRCRWSRRRRPFFWACSASGVSPTPQSCKPASSSRPTANPPVFLSVSSCTANVRPVRWQYKLTTDTKRWLACWAPRTRWNAGFVRRRPPSPRPAPARDAGRIPHGKIQLAPWHFWSPIHHWQAKCINSAPWPPLLREMGHRLCANRNRQAPHLPKARGPCPCPAGVSFHGYTFRAVLMTFTPLNRVVAEPWLTDDTCEGWPLPSKKVPNRR